ncbi:MAG: POTRA domain-containing protein [Rhodanobacter sp.]
MKARIRWTLGIAIAMAAQAQAQVRPPSTVNPLENLPRVQAPSNAPSVNTNVQTAPPNPRLLALLAHTLTPQRFDVVGVHAVPFADIAALFSPMNGKQVRVADLVAASGRIAEIYKAHGYALSFGYIPAQDFANGLVQVRVIEGYVAKVDVSGDAGNMEPRIRAIAQHIAEDRPLRQATFERYLQVLGMLPGVRVNASVPAPATTDGATRLVLDVQRTRYNATAGIDFNHPGTQGLLTAIENGMTPLNEQLSVSTLYPTGRGDQELFAANYLQPIGSRGWMGTMSGSYYSGNPDTDGQLPSYLLHNLTQNRLALGVSYPLWLNSQSNLSVNAGIYGSNQNDHYLNTITNATLEQKNDLRVVHTGLDYSYASPTMVRKATFEVAQGINAWGAEGSSTTQIGGQTIAVPSDVSFTRYDASFVQSNAWSHNFGTVFSISGQYSSDNLPSTEQINFGGPRYGLAYDPGDAAGDSGWGASFEVNHYYNVSTIWLKRWTPYAVIQVARVHLNAGTPLLSQIGTAAVGVRLTDNKHYTIDISVAQPTGQKPTEEERREARWNLTFSYQLK